MLDFGAAARKQQANFRHRSATISLESRGQRRGHGHLMAKGRQSDNLYPGLRDGVVEIRGRADAEASTVPLVGGSCAAVIITANPVPSFPTFPLFPAFPALPSFPHSWESIGVDDMLDFGTTARKRQVNFRHKSSAINCINCAIGQRH